MKNLTRSLGALSRGMLFLHGYITATQVIDNAVLPSTHSVSKERTTSPARLEPQSRRES